MSMFQASLPWKCILCDKYSLDTICKDCYNNNDNNNNNNNNNNFILIDENEYFLGKQKCIQNYYECECNYYNHDDCCSNVCLNKYRQFECVSKSCQIEKQTNNSKLCNNRKFQRKQYKDVKVLCSGDTELGLFANEYIASNEFIIEYIGEIIDETECKRRLKDVYYFNNKFYIIQFKRDTSNNKRSVYSIDATQKGGKARYINHSCSPNCSAEQWTVGDEQRIGIFALQNIQKGDELTFCYQYKQQQENAIKTKCLCGSSKCKGYI